jgi:N-acetylmuramoyl-L-alanine amidase
MKPIFDNGHGGVIGGKYQTPGKRSPKWECGVLYEGMFNRWVVNRLIEKMDRCGLIYYHISPEKHDVPLWQRCERANKIHGKDPNTYLISIHANAGGGEGIEGFTSPGVTKSDQIAEIFLRDLEINLEGLTKFRFDETDGDRDKEAKFKILVDSKCPAFLFEAGFMDHREDYEKLWSEDYLERIVDSLFESIKSIYK